MDRASHTGQSRGVRDAHTIAEPLTHFSVRQPAERPAATADSPLVPCTAAVGRRLLVEVDDAAAARSLAAWVRDARHRGDEVVPAARTVLFDGVADLAALRDALAGWDPDRPEPPTAAWSRSRCRYDGPDLAFVAEHWGIDRGRRRRRPRARSSSSPPSAGSRPGFSYLAGLPEERAVPRLDSPRARVPAGVGRPGRHLVRRLPDGVAGRLADPRAHRRRALGRRTATEPALLPPGTRVRFVAAT